MKWGDSERLDYIEQHAISGHEIGLKLAVGGMIVHWDGTVPLREVLDNCYFQEEMHCRRVERLMDEVESK